MARGGSSLSDNMVDVCKPCWPAVTPNTSNSLDRTFNPPAQLLLEEKAARPALRTSTSVRLFGILSRSKLASVAHAPRLAVVSLSAPKTFDRRQLSPHSQLLSPIRSARPRDHDKICDNRPLPYRNDTPTTPPKSGTCVRLYVMKRQAHPPLTSKRVPRVCVHNLQCKNRADIRATAR